MKEAYNNVDRNSMATTLKGNAIILLKQAAAYII